VNIQDYFNLPPSEATAIRRQIILAIWPLGTPTKPCDKCHSGSCALCWGAGEIYDWPDAGDDLMLMTCPRCNGSGRCRHCNGAGVTLSHEENNQ
jgi:hypothetical protein